MIACSANFIASEPNPNNFLQPLIPYSSFSIDYGNANAVSPFDSQQIESNYFRHWLGTNELGQDVLAQLIHGSKTALTIGVGVILIAAIIGILLGGIAGYFGDSKLITTKGKLLSFLTVLPVFLLFVFFIIPWGVSSVSISEKLLSLVLTGIVSIILTYLFNKTLF